MKERGRERDIRTSCEVCVVVKDSGELFTAVFINNHHKLQHTRAYTRARAHARTHTPDTQHKTHTHTHTYTQHKTHTHTHAHTQHKIHYQHNYTKLHSTQER